MKPSIVFLIISIVIVFGTDLILSVLRKAYLDKLAGCLMEGKLSEFDSLMQKKLVRFIMPGFNIDYLSLNRHIAEMNDDKVREYIELFGTRRLNEAQKKAVYQQGFNYFIIKNDERYARRCYEELKKLNNMKEQMQDLDIIYKVVIEKKKELIEQLINEIKKTEGAERIEKEALIAQLYSYIGNEQEAEKFLKAALEDKKKLDEEK